MATNKHASIRYLALDKCFRNPGRKYFIDDLLKECEKAISEYSGSTKAISKRTFYNDLDFMKSEQGWAVPIETTTENRKVYYRYSDLNFSIKNQPLNEMEATQLKEALLTLSKFKGMPQFEWIEEIIARLDATFKLSEIEEEIIGFESNPYLRGIDYISTLYNGIAYKKTFKIEYQGYRQEKPSKAIYHPYYLKQYNNRWFLFALQNSKNRISNLALDRIRDISEATEPFIENTIIDFSEYFEDAVGVTIDREPVKVRLKIENSLWPYIKSKPIHDTQKEMKSESDNYPNHTILELFVIPNYELKSLLFSYGERLTILDPPYLAKEIKERAEKIISNYS